MKTIIETERLILRPFDMNDAEAVYEFNSNPEIMKYTGDELLHSLERAKEIINDVWFSDYEKYGYGRYAVVHKADNKVIGFCGLKYLPELDATDIGYRFLPEYWGKGIATEAAKPFIEYGFKHFGLKRIIGIAMPDNIGSCKVLEKIGLSFYKVDDYNGDGIMCNWYEIHNSNKSNND